MFNMFQKQKTNNQQQVAPPDDQIYLDLEIYVLYDSKVGTYRLPSFQASKWDVIRNLEQMFEDPQQAQNDVVRNPEDFTLFKLGGYSRKFGKIILTSAPESVIGLHEIKSTLRNKKHDQ